MNKDASISIEQSLSALLRKGFRALELGQIKEASQCCQQALRLKPELVPAHFLVGLIGLEARDRKTAFSAFRSVTRLQASHAAAWAHMAKLFMGEGQVSRADKALTEAVRHVRDEPIVFDLIGTVYSLMGEYGLANEWFGKANQRQPDYPPFMLNYASNLVFHGKTAEANRVFESILKLQPNSPQAHWTLAGSRKASNREHIAVMQEFAEKPGLDPRALAYYQYAIGKEMEDLGAWDEAFEAFEAGARARRQTIEFDEAAEAEMFAFLTSHFTADRYADTEGHASSAPIFILGQPRTGTTLIDRIISSHSSVHSAGELQQFGLALRRLSNHQDSKRFSASLFAAALKLDPQKIGAMYIDTTRRMQGDTPRFVDKLPQNYLMIPLILAALPNAKIIHVTRSPMDACFASFKQLFADAYLHSYDLQEMARHHARYFDLMATWRKRFAGRFYDISYESTVTNLESNVRPLLEFLELPWEDACLNFHQQKTAVATASAVQVREPAHTRSIGRWRCYAQQLQPVLATLIEAGLPLSADGERLDVT